MASCDRESAVATMGITLDPPHPVANAARPVGLGCPASYTDAADALALARTAKPLFRRDSPLTQGTVPRS